MSVLGIDIGTTGCKSVAFAQGGRVLSSSFRHYSLHNPSTGMWELDAEQVWRCTVETIREAAAATHSDKVEAIAVSALGEAIVPVDNNFKPLCGAPVSADFRAEAETARLEKALGKKRIYQTTGQPISLNYSLPKMMWWRENAPEIYKKTWKFLCFGDYALAQMGLTPTIDPSLASRTLAFDLKTGAWSETMMEVAGIPSDKMAEIAKSGAVVGTLDDHVAAHLGLPPGVVAVNGGFDQACGAFGAGVENSGTGYYGLGTTEALAVVVDHILDQFYMINASLCPHVAGDQFLVMGGSQTGGRLLQWFKDELATGDSLLAKQKNIDVYDFIIKSASKEVAPLLVLPHFTGSGSYFSDPDSKGAIVGLTFKSTRADIAKAILEGTTYEQAILLNEFAHAGVKVEQLNAVGSGAKSDTLLQLKADIVGLKIVRPDVGEAACRGAALLAYRAIGKPNSFCDTNPAQRPPSSRQIPTWPGPTKALSQIFPIFTRP